MFISSDKCIIRFLFQLFQSKRYPISIVEESMASKHAKTDKISSDINPGNAIQRVEECQNYLTLQQWSKFYYLYPQLQKFQDIRMKGPGMMRQDDDEFTNAWNTLRANAINLILKNLEGCSQFEQYIDWMNHLSEIVPDQRCLWNLLHTELQPSLKVTLEQSHQIASKYFTTEMLFQFSIESFLNSELVDVSAVKNEDDIIDIFYATVGFLRSCNLDPEYIITLPEYIELTKNLLFKFISIPNFDAHRFVWLVEAIYDHFHVNKDTLKSICESVLKKFTSTDTSNLPAISRLHKICIISTSPFLQQFSKLQQSVDAVFTNVLKEQHVFVNKYIFGSYVRCQWDNKNEVPRKTDPLMAWVLFVKSTSNKLKAKNELPSTLLVDLIDDSLAFFTGYYSEVQPLKETAVSLRMDIFDIVDTCREFYPGKLPPSTLQNIWFLLHIAAISGAKKEMLSNIKADASQKGDQFRGLEHDEKDFNNYEAALSRLKTNFEINQETYQAMIRFIRKRYEGEFYGNDDSDEEEEEKGEKAEKEKK